MAYEIRVLRTRHSHSVVLSATCRNDAAAIAAGLRAADGRPVEVWRGMTCLYQDAWDGCALAH